MRATIEKAERFRKHRCPSNSRNRAARREVYNRRLRCEMLEERQMLAPVSWIGGTTGYWDVAANWSNAAVPNSATAVSIATSGATVTIRSGDTASASSLTVAAGNTLSIVVGSLTTTAGLTNSGTIIVNPGCDLTVTGSYTQAAGAALSMPGGGDPTHPTTNWIVNADFESPVRSNSTTPPATWWTWGSSYLSSQYAYTGSQSLVVTGANSGVTEQFAATPGNSYTASVYAMTPATDPLTGNAAGYLHLQFFDSSDNLISSYNAPNSITILTASSATGGPLAGSVGNQGWNHFHTTAVAPSGAAYVQAQVEIYSPGGTAGGSVYYDDVELGPAAPGPSQFVAGSLSNSGTLTVGPTNTVTTRHVDANLDGHPRRSTGRRTLYGKFRLRRCLGGRDARRHAQVGNRLRLLAFDDRHIHPHRVRQRIGELRQRNAAERSRIPVQRRRYLHERPDCRRPDHAAQRHRQRVDEPARRHDQPAGHQHDLLGLERRDGSDAANGDRGGAQYVSLPRRIVFRRLPLQCCEQLL